jgi:hypothetical protein
MSVWGRINKYWVISTNLALLFSFFKSDPPLTWPFSQEKPNIIL